MGEKNFNEMLAGLSSQARSFLQAYVNLLKVQLLEKAARIGTHLITITLVILIVAFVLLLITFAFSFWYGQEYNDYFGGFMISAGFYILIGLIIVIFRKQIIGGPIIRKIASEMFDNEKEDSNES